MFNKISFLLLAVCLSTAAVAQGDEIKLSLSETLKIAVERNLDIQLQRLNINTGNISLESTRAVYEPTVTGLLSYGENESLPQDRDQGASVFESVNYTWNGSFEKREYWGFGWSVDFNSSKDSSNAANGLGTYYSNVLNVGFSQELLKGFAFNGLSLDKEILKYDEYIAQHDLDLTAYDLENRINSVLQSTENAYWDLVYARENLEVSKASLKLAQELYKQNETKVKVGTLAPIELVNDESEIASREQNLITTENQLLAAEDALRKILNMPPKDWTKRMVPTESLVISPVQANFEMDLEIAMKNRVEMKKDRGEMRKAELTLKKRENDLLPSLTLRGGYGQSGRDTVDVILGVDPATGLPYDADENPIIAGTIGPEYTDAVQNMLNADGNGLSASLNLSWKPFNKAAKLDRARARVGIRQQEVNMASTRLNVMESVASAIRDLNANFKAIEAAEKTVKLRQENLKAEEQKFQNGLSTNYFVTEKQNQLASAETSLIQTKVNYLKAVTSYYSALGKLVENRGIRVQ